MACRGGCCSSAGRLNADNARFLLLAVLIVLYMLCGAAVFSAIELPTEREAKERWEERLENFTRRHNLSRAELRRFLREYEEASVAGIRVDDIRPRWDFTGAFYFVGTVVSTIGERRDPPAAEGRAGDGAAAAAAGRGRGRGRPEVRSPLCARPAARARRGLRAGAGHGPVSSPLFFLPPPVREALPREAPRLRSALSPPCSAPEAFGSPSPAARPAARSAGAVLGAGRAPAARVFPARCACLRGGTWPRHAVADAVSEQSHPKPKAVNERCMPLQPGKSFCSES
uniref:Potassium channel subfamily K member 13 n=1 Tax=Accipiter nisus TaxID=211598 RepID=A0A8B9RYI7_9AVES